MILSLTIGLILGFGMSIPPGPISVAIIRKGIQGSKQEGTLIGIGASLMDGLYAFVAVLASSAIFNSFKEFLTEHVWLELGFQLVCIVVLMLMGLKYNRAHVSDLQHSTDVEEERENAARRFGFTSGFMVGILMAVMNLANPSFLPSMIAVASFVVAKGWIHADLLSGLSYAIGFLLGVFIWFYTLLRIVTHMRARLPATYFTYIFKFAGGAFILFAVILAFRVLFATEWSTLL